MSSSNYVRLAYIQETSYGVTPPTGDFKTARFTDEKLSGTPGTTESKQIRTDRMSGGQIVTGLTVGGQIAVEYAREQGIDDMMASAMLNTWATMALQTVALSLDASAKTATRSSGSFIADGLVVGDFVTLAGFTNAANNVSIMVAEIVSATQIRYVGPKQMVTEVGTVTTYKRADKLTIGTVAKSFSIEKTFLDLTNKGIKYTGMVVNQMEVSVAFGDLVKGSFTMSGNGYETFDQASDMMTNGRVIDPAATSNTFNGSIDMPILANSAIGILDNSNLAIQSVALTLNNNFSPENVIGSVAPQAYSAGTAAITIKLAAYLSDDGWSILDRKLTQDAFAIGFQLKNTNGWYGVYMPAVQVSFEDPGSSGQNAQISLDMSGTAKVGDGGASALVLYRS